LKKEVKPFSIQNERFKILDSGTKVKPKSATTGRAGG